LAQNSFLEDFAKFMNYVMGVKKKEPPIEPHPIELPINVKHEAPPPPRKDLGIKLEDKTRPDEPSSSNSIVGQ
jgi:hypothetical protein